MWLELEHVSRRFGARAAVNGVTFRLPRGSIGCLLGPSGCGKTTALRCIAGFESVDEGSIRAHGRLLSTPQFTAPPETRQFGMVFQDYALFPHLSVLENVAFGLHGLDRAARRRRAGDMLATVGLADYGAAYPHQLSGGQQQRVALARALVPRPSVMLMDEPFSGLDVQLRDTMQEETLALLRETRATAMVVTHHPEEAVRLGDRIAVMSAGRIVQVGTTEDLYHRPAELFIARLFSEINEVPFVARGGQIETPVGNFPVPGAADGQKATLCIRERGLQLHPAGTELPGRVLHVKFFGDFALVELAVEGFVAPLRTRVAHTEGWEKGREVGVGIDRSRLLVFPVRIDESN